jgi:hypothetical protein
MYFKLISLFLISGMCLFPWTKLDHVGLKKSYYIRSFARTKSLLFIGTTTGFYYKKKNNPEISQFFSLGQEYITSIHASGESEAWVGTYSGVYKLDLSKFATLAHYNKSGTTDSLDGSGAIAGLSSDNITSIAGHDETIFVGTDRWGINLIDVKTGKISKTKITSIDGLPSDRINHIYITPSMIVVSTSAGIAWKGRWDKFWDEVPEGSLAKDVKVQQTVFLNNKLYLGTSGEGILSFSIDTPETVVQYNSTKGDIPSDFVQGIAADGDFLWVATFEGLARYNVKQNNWKMFPNITSETLDKVFIDGTHVYVGSDGDSVFEYNKELPEIAFAPELEYGNKRMYIVGSIVSDTPINKITAESLKYRDADILGPYSSKGVKIVLDKDVNIYHDKLAYIDFNENPLGVGKLWNFEVSLDIEDKKGNKNKATAIFMYDSKTPKIQLLKFEKEAVQFSQQPVYTVQGKIQDFKIKYFNYIMNDKKTPVPYDNYFKFNMPIKLPSVTNKIKFEVSDYCGNVTTQEITIIKDTKPPKIIPKPTEVLMSKEESKIFFTFDELFLENAVIIDPDNPIPINCEIDSLLKKITANIEPPAKPKNLKLELYDKARNKTEYKFILKTDDSKPVILLNTSDNEIITEKKNYTLTGKVFSTTPVNVYIKDRTNSIDADYNPSTKKFSITLSLKKRYSKYIIMADGGEKRITEKDISIQCTTIDIAASVNSKEGTVSKEGQITVDKSVIEEMKRLQAQVDKLKKEVSAERKKTEEIRKSAGKQATASAGKTKTRSSVSSGTQKQTSSSVRSSGVSAKTSTSGNRTSQKSAMDAFLGSEPALMAVKYTKYHNLKKIAIRYLSDERLSVLISMINDYIPAADIKKKKKVIIPNGTMVQFLLENQNPAALELIRSCVYGLFYDANKNIPKFVRILKSFQQNYMVPVTITSRKSNIIISQKGTKAKVLKKGVRKFNKIILNVREKTVHVKII